MDPLRGRRHADLCNALPNKRLQLTPNSPLQSIRGTVLAAGAVSRRTRTAPWSVIDDDAAPRGARWPAGR